MHIPGPVLRERKVAAQRGWGKGSHPSVAELYLHIPAAWITTYGYFKPSQFSNCNISRCNVSSASENWCHCITTTQCWTENRSYDQRKVSITQFLSTWLQSSCFTFTQLTHQHPQVVRNIINTFPLTQWYYSSTFLARTHYNQDVFPWSVLSGIISKSQLFQKHCTKFDYIPYIASEPKIQLPL